MAELLNMNKEWVDSSFSDEQIVNNDYEGKPFHYLFSDIDYAYYHSIVTNIIYRIKHKKKDGYEVILIQGC